MADSDDVKYREWTIALGVTTTVFFVTTIVLAVILFCMICRKIANLRKERDSRETGVLQGVTTSPHWIDHTNLHDMLERDEHIKQPDNIWSVSTQTFNRNRNQTQQQMTSSLPATTVGGSAEEEVNRETDDGERTTSMSGSFSPNKTNRGVKPKRQAPSPPKTRTKSKSKGCNGVTKEERDNDPMPYVYPIHKLQLHQAPKATGGNQSHEYAQPHSLKHDDDGKVTVANGKHVYHALDPSCKQPAGQYQQLYPNGLPRGQSLPAISLFTTHANN